MLCISTLKKLITFPALSLAILAQAQQKISPIINPDHTVTFTLKSASASNVKIKGTWMKENAIAVDMIKMDSSWSYTTSKLEGDLYRYNFYLDGVEITDPSNSYVERAGIRYESIFILPGEQSNLYTVNDVPHGTLSAVWYPSPTLHAQRRMFVYTPPSYFENKKQNYPVL